MEVVRRLSDRIGAMEERSTERNRENLRTGQRSGPPNRNLGRSVLGWGLLLIWPASQAFTGRYGPAWLLLGGLVLLAAMFVVLCASPHSGYWRLTHYVVLAPFVALSLALAGAFAGNGYFIVILPAIMTTMVLPLVRPAFVGLLVLTGLTVLVAVGTGFDGWLGTALSAFMSGFVVFILRRLFATIELLREAREDLAVAAVADERLRFSRDLHDLLGHTLSVIVVKAEVVRRLAPRDAERAAAAAADIETVGRQALVEVREAVTGYRQRPLADELDGARAALADAGVTATVRRDTGRHDERADALLGWAVREGTTNVIRHSGATRCTLALRYAAGDAVLEIHDDGTGTTADGTGNGLRGLTERFAAAGGTVRTTAGGGGFTLTATVPAAAGDGCA